MKSLDTLCDKYAKKWAGVPRSGTNIILHCPQTLNIPTITQLYRESHATTHSSTRLKGDTTVNDVLDVKLAREGQWTQKKSTAVYSESLFQQASSESSQHLSPKTKLNTIKSKVKKFIKEDSERQRAEHAKELIKQGRLIQLLQEMEMDATWKSYLFALPKGTMKFILNSTIDTLPTKTNLKLWGLSGSDKCKLCLLYTSDAADE